MTEVLTIRTYVLRTPIDITSPTKFFRCVFVVVYVPWCVRVCVFTLCCVSVHCLEVESMATVDASITTTTTATALPSATRKSQPTVAVGRTAAVFGRCMLKAVREAAHSCGTHRSDRDGRLVPLWDFSDTLPITLHHDVASNVVTLAPAPADVTADSAAKPSIAPSTASTTDADAPAPSAGGTAATPAAPAAGAGAGAGASSAGPSPSCCTASHVVPLSHAKFCPSFELHHGRLKGQALPDPAQWVRTGVVVLLVAPDGAVLLTQRAAHMRSFPSVWVLPGGHVDAGETLREAGARELREETGVTVPAAALELLCVWESNYPINDVPIRQHCAIYYVARLHGDALPALTLDPSEVAAAVWVTPPALQHLVRDAGARLGGADATGDVPVMPRQRAAAGAAALDEVPASTVSPMLSEGSRFAMAVFAGAGVKL